ncbi:hypothetical protein SAMN04488128_10227 [Chitinophaga eiseniae]|uniref:Uncharacterized protein n=1 Tax=Chitinophaga eiseniae TaxID=634771 RepID=A0A1T4PVJ6_9BACT|nr:hypothetical protein [Chitinophaga eiseniae]SJZ95552.1 hypothetical protein SAMN04488128_10227 [Chitinophaga eiseniae]
MKKLKLENLHFSNEDLLSREELKKIFGGLDGSDGSGHTIWCTGTYSGSGNTTLQVTNACSSPDMDACHKEMKQECDRLASDAGGSCLQTACQ